MQLEKVITCANTAIVQAIVAPIILPRVAIKFLYKSYNHAKSLLWLAELGSLGEVKYLIFNILLLWKVNILVYYLRNKADQ